MRLHRLEMLAVGPFADRQDIDFDRLGSGGLFLFEGPTGVGKSTILDALAFALYGGLASDSGDVARMRSDFADPLVRPEVRLEFSVRGVRYRITRSPEHSRPKKRGTGVTREKSSVLLERSQAEGWSTVSHAKDEVGEMVGELLGLNREQFRQVVLLPQGEFATFLHADDDRRRDVLAKLFGTAFFRSVVERLQQRAHDVRVAVSQAEAALAARVAAAWEAAGRLPQEGAVSEALPAPLETLSEVAGELSDAADAARAEAAAAEAEQASARESLTRAESVSERVDRRAELEAILARAESERVTHADRVERLGAARRAEPVRPLVDMLAGLTLRIEQARSTARVLGAGEVELLTGGGADQLIAEARQARAVADGLGHVVAAEAQLTDLRDARSEASALQAAAQQEVADLTARLAALPAEISGARNELADAMRRAAAAEVAALRVTTLTEQLDAARRLADLDGELATLMKQRRAVARSATRAGDHVHLLEEGRRSSMGAELARQLVNGDPCVVCGSREHPAPAIAGEAEVAEADLREAIHAREEAQVHLMEVELRIARAQGERAPLAERVAGGSVPEWEEQLAAAAEDLAASETARRSVPELEDRVAALELAAHQLAADRTTLGDGLAQVTAEVSALDERIAAIDHQVQAAREGHGSVGARVAVLIAGAEQLEAQASAIAQLGAAIAEQDRVAGQAEHEAQRAGFADLARATAAILDSAELGRLQAAIDEWEAQVATATAQLDAPGLGEVIGLDPRSVREAAQVAREALAVATATATEALRAATVASRQCGRFAERLAEVREAAAAVSALRAEGEEIIALDLYARGMAGSPRMTLVTYVLRYWFEQVVAAANLRLAAMSAGKYELLRTNEGARKDARVGLGLAVLDRHTGRERSPATLSGGETFYTSLALALGLADVVVAQAGGAQLDTLFIDEGFGSLDADTLEDVMSVIDELRGNGRVVGIVSHVPDLKERIAERLSVRRSRPDGPSRIEVVA